MKKSGIFDSIFSDQERITTKKLEIILLKKKRRGCTLGLQVGGTRDGGGEDGTDTLSGGKGRRETREREGGGIKGRGMEEGRDG